MQQWHSTYHGSFCEHNRKNGILSPAGAIMQNTSPRAWPWSAAGSPEPYPEQAWVQNLRKMFGIELNNDIKQQTKVTGDELLDWLAECTVTLEDEEIKLGEWLSANGKSAVADRTPFLLCGELANPYRLVDLGISGMPIIPVRMDGICRVWTDVIDGREVQPGIHHVTLARTTGWWETTWMGFADKEQARIMTEWLNDGRGTAWRWAKLAEGEISIHFGGALYSPEHNQISWDGECESIHIEPPKITGPIIERSRVRAILFTKQGCYDNRGKLARCANIKQRQFHAEMFRRGSAGIWNEIIDIE